MDAFKEKVRFLEEEDEEKPCAEDPPGSGKTKDGVEIRTCIKLRRKQDMEYTTRVFLGVLIFLSFIGMVCLCVAYKSVGKNCAELFASCQCCCKTEDRASESEV